MKATNFARASYQEVYDIMTKDGKVSIFGFHTPTGAAPYRMLSGFFRQFRKYRYAGMSASLIPAAQLPADPLQISYAAGTENYIDPRDLQNPILFHGAHGENLGAALNRIYTTTGSYANGTSADLKEIDNDIPIHTERGNPTYGPSIEDWYYTAMLDPSFRKFNVMSNIKLPYMHPRVHTLNTDLRIQSYYGGISQDLTQVDPELVGSVTGTNQDITGVIEDMNPFIPTVLVDPNTAQPYSTKTLEDVKLMSGKTQRLGWLDTFTFSRASDPASAKYVPQPSLSPLPRLMMGVLVMPPSYRVQLCFRMVLTHYFEFARFNTAITEPNFTSITTTTHNQFDENYHNWLPDSLTAEAMALSDSVDAINGEVKQTVSGVY